MVHYGLVRFGTNRSGLYGTIGYQDKRQFGAMNPDLKLDPVDGDAGRPMAKRILAAAICLFMEKGYAGTSTLEIATRAKVSKRDLYAHFGSKEAMLVACIAGRSAQVGLTQDLPTPQSRKALVKILHIFAATMLREVTHPEVIAMHRLAIAEAKRSPEIAATLESAGRDATRLKLVDLLARAQAAGLIGKGDPDEMASEFLALLWRGLLLDILLGQATAPSPAEIERRATKAAKALLQLHPLAVGAG